FARFESDSRIGMAFPLFVKSIATEISAEMQQVREFFTQPVETACRVAALCCCRRPGSEARGSMTALGEAVISGSAFGGRPATPASHAGPAISAAPLTRAPSARHRW